MSKQVANQTAINQPFKRRAQHLIHKVRVLACPQNTKQSTLQHCSKNIDTHKTKSTKHISHNGRRGTKRPPPRRKPQHRRPHHMWTNHKHVPTPTRTRILNRDHHTCQHCGTQPPPTHLEIDHITPLAAGGTNADNNLQTLCKTCHQKKTRSEINTARRHRTARARMATEPHPGLK